MTEVLLKELSNQDIDWMLATGSRKEIATGATLIRQGESVQALYVLLDGALTVSVAQPDDNPIGRAFAALEGDILTGREIARLSDGELVGELPFLDSHLASTTVQATRPSLILTIPWDQLMEKLRVDSSFSAHFYRSVAIFLADRLEQIVQQVSNSTTVLCQPQLREILFIFGELHDSDIGWMISVGDAMRVPAGTVLIQGNRPVESLYILLDGKMSASTCADANNPLTRAFSTLDNSRDTLTPEMEVAQLSRGDIMGETSFLESSPPSVTVKAIVDSVVLSIPRWRLTTKLLNDLDFSSRFYRVLSILLTDKQQGIISRLGYGRLTYSSDKSLDDSQLYDSELSYTLLAQVTLAGTRFDWMMKQLGNH